MVGSFINMKKIKQIIKRKEKINVYDIEVKDNHNFFANNILVHNCHNYGTPRLLDLIKKDFKYKIGLSATTERLDNKHWKIFEIFNYNVFKYSPEEALNDGVLNPFNFTNISIHIDDDSMIKYEELSQKLNVIFLAHGGFSHLMRSNNPIKFKMLNLMTERKKLVNNHPYKFEVLKKIVTKHKNDKVIVFNQFNEQTNKVYWYLLDIGVKARIMHSGISYEKRDENLRAIKNDKANVLCASKVIDEGWNLPKADVAIIMAGDSSAKQTIQRFGRVLRRKKNISNIYQLYCYNTIEHRDALSRTTAFKDLSQEYIELKYHDGDDFII